MKPILLSSLKTALCLAIALMSISCGQRKAVSPDTEFSTWISAYSGGMLGTDATIRIVFGSPLSSLTDADGNPVTGMDRKDLDRLFSFSPALKGTARIVGDDTVEFIPDDGQLKPGTVYKANFRLGDAVNTGDSRLDNFRFSFATAPKEVQMEVDWMMISEKSIDKARVVGTLYFSEPPVPDAEMRMLSCSYPDKSYRMTFKRSEDGLSSRFQIAGLARGDEDRILTLSVDGSSDGFGSRQEEKVIIPAKTGFKVAGAELVEATNPYVDITFSQPVDKKSNLSGMFRIDGAGRTWTDVTDNIVRLYFEDFDSDGMTLQIAAGIRSCSGERLEAPVEINLSGNELKPAVEIPLKGNILPDDKELLLPLRAVNLSAVDISVVRIYEDNILYFLQDNDLGDDNELRRFGRLVCKQTVRLDTDPGLDLGKWQDFAIDLSGLFRQEPGAIYRIRVSFCQDYSLYGKRLSARSPEGTNDAGTLIKLRPEDLDDEDALIWDTPSPYYYESFHKDGYNWRERNNPDRPTYYMMGNRFPYCNLMTSDLGIIAKSAEDGNIWVAVNDIISAEPVEGASVKVYNYQLRLIGEAETDSKGFASIETSGVPFAVTASSGKSISYLKVTSGSEKSLSRFDTGGQKIEAGLKCFIYGERGVWRPGDTLHISAMIDDPQDRIPDSHPVTMELYSPLGQFHTRMVNNKGTDGLYVFDIPTSADDPTGTWNAYFKVGGSSFHKALMIETIKPNRLKISLETSENVLQSGQKTRLRLAASWLTGPAADGLNGKVEMNLSPAGKTFKGYEGYIFYDPTVPASQTSVKLLDARLDGKGIAEKDIVMPALDKAPGMMEARLVSSVQESGGDESITSKTVLFSPYSAYVGIRMPGSSGDYLETDTTHTFKVTVIDKDGRRIKGHRIEYRIFKIDWSWWWESKAEELASYVNSSSAKPYSKGSFVSSSEGVHEIPFRLDYPQWGRFLVYVKDLDSGHATGCIFTADWPAYRGRSDKKDPDALTMLTFSTDKKEYKVGEQVTVFIPAADGGRALVSLENGSRILSSDWVETSADGDTPYKFTVTEEMSPNFYIHISLLQKHGNTSNDLPVRMYGVMPVMVENPESHLHPQISMPDVVRPLEEFSVRISERDGKKMTYTLAIVDEGLLDITAFRTPDPWSAMYAREALGVKTWDLYDNVIGAFGGRLSPMASIGGDQMINKESRQDNRFNPVVRFLGPFSLDKRENVHKITLPMYVGSVRVMVVAGKDGAYGNADRTIPVRTPLMVLPTLPRSLAPGEQFTLPVNVFAMERPEPDVKVSVSVSGNAEVISDKSQHISFAETGDKLVNFTLRTTGEGSAKVTVTATGGGYTASETLSVPVRNPNPTITSRYTAMLESGESTVLEYGPLSGTGASAVLGLSSLPAMDIHGTFRYMMDYGNDCSEQLAARGITLLSLKKLLAAEETAAVDSLVPLLLGKLYARQLADGGFPVWPGQAAANEWVSSMAGQFMSLAAAQGFEVDKGVFSSWLNFQKRCVRNYKESSAGNASARSAASNQAYRLYTLALASAAEDGAMNRLREAGNISGPAKWLLASAYAIDGKKSVAKGIISGLKTETAEYSPDDRTYSSPLRDKAIMLESLVLTDDIQGALALAADIADDSGVRMLTTQYSAFMASAMSRMADKLNTGALHAEVGYPAASDQATEKINSADAVASKSLDISEKSVMVKNLSDGPVYAVITAREKPAPDTAISAASSGIGLAVSWSDLDGNPVSPEKLAQGTDFRMTVTVMNNSGTADLSSLALNIPVPSGWEIFNERLYGTTSAEQSGYEYMDIRDDKAMYYFDLDKGTRKSFSVRLRAAYKGEFILPSISCEAMYSPENNARTASGKAIVY